MSGGAEVDEVCAAGAGYPANAGRNPRFSTFLLYHKREGKARKKAASYRRLIQHNGNTVQRNDNKSYKTAKRTPCVFTQGILWGAAAVQGTRFTVLRGSGQSLHLLIDALLAAAHGQNGLFHQLLDGPAQALGAGVDDIAGAAGGELLVLVLFLP